MKVAAQGRSLHARRPTLVAIGVLLAIVAVLFRDTLILGGVFYNRDIHLNWISQVEGVVRSYAAGSWPLWDQSPGFGQPLLADAGAEVFYPFAWLNLVMKPWTYYTWFVASHALFSSSFVFLLGRKWGLTGLGATTAATVWLLSGPYLSLIDLWQHFAGASWMPAVVLAFEYAADRNDAKAVLVSAASLTGQILAGSADMTALTLAVVAGNLIVVGVDRSASGGKGKAEDRRGFLPLAGKAIVAVSMAVGATACLWIPAAEVAGRSARASLPIEIRTFWSVHPLGLLEIVLPGIWNVGRLAGDVEGLLFEGRDPFLATLYLGLPCLGLVGLALSRRRAREIYLAIVLALAILIALGRHAPVYGWVTTLVPPARIFRFPVKAMIVAAFAWSLLAGAGADRARQLATRGSRSIFGGCFFPLRFFAVAALAVAAFALLRPATFGSLVLDLDGSYLLSDALRPLVLRTALAGGAALAMLAVPHVAASGRARAVAFAFIAVAELAVQHRDPSPVAPRAFYEYTPPVLGLLSPLPASRVYVYDYTEPGKSARYLRRPHAFPARRPLPGWSEAAASALVLQGSLVPQTAGRWGLRQGYDLDYRNLFPRMSTELGRALRDVEGTPVHARLLRIGGITHVVALHQSTFRDLALTGTVMTPDPLYVYAVPGTMPRVYATSGVRTADGIESFRVLADPSFDPRTEVVLETGAASPRASGSPGSARVVHEQPDRIVVEAEMGETGHVVVLDTYDPGWRATVDGQPAPLLVGNGVFRAVGVPAGRHLLELVYRPRALLVGLGVSGVSVFLAALTWLLSSRGSASAPVPIAESRP